MDKIMDVSDDMSANRLGIGQTTQSLLKGNAAVDVLKIGVTGSAGSGKSLVCKGFQELGLVTLDCDQIAREVVEPGEKTYAEVVASFGKDILRTDLTLDRARLRQVMVDQPESRQKLENLLHPAIIQRMADQIIGADYSREPACAIEVPLLFELGMESFFDVTLVVTCSDQRLVERICARDKVSQDSARKMLALQMSQSDKVARADYVIENQGESQGLLAAVKVLYGKLKKERLTKK